MKVGSPTQVRRTPYFPAALPGFSYRPYDISPDGRRFLMIKEIAPTSRGRRASEESSSSSTGQKN
jgi:hypothetical protein